jgi:nitroreductase
MEVNVPGEKTCAHVIRQRRSVRHFSGQVPDRSVVDEIVKSAIYAPYGGATGIPLHEIRKIFVFSRGTRSFKQVRALLLAQLKKKARTLNATLILMPMNRKKMAPFANRLNTLAQHGIPTLDEAAHYIVVAEKRGFPPVAKQSIAHALQNMWLSATDHCLGFQLLSATGMMAGNKQFMALLGLAKGEYELDGCLIGIPQDTAVEAREYELADFVTWLD